MNEMPGSQNAEVQQGVERLSVLMAAGVDEHLYENHPDAVRAANGELRIMHNGVPESIWERESRLEHNAYVRFSRSLDSTLPV